MEEKKLMEMSVAEAVAALDKEFGIKNVGEGPFNGESYRTNDNVYCISKKGRQEADIWSTVFEGFSGNQNGIETKLTVNIDSSANPEYITITLNECH